MCSAGLSFYITLAAGSLPHALALGLSPVHATHPSSRALEPLLADCEVTYARTGVCTCVLGSWGLKGRCYRKARVASEAPACEGSRRQGRAAVASARRRGGFGSSSPAPQAEGALAAPQKASPFPGTFSGVLSCGAGSGIASAGWRDARCSATSPAVQSVPSRRLWPLAGRAHRGLGQQQTRTKPFLLGERTSILAA